MEDWSSWMEEEEEEEGMVDWVRHEDECGSCPSRRRRWRRQNATNALTPMEKTTGRTMGLKAEQVVVVVVVVIIAVVVVVDGPAGTSRGGWVCLRCCP